MSVFSFFKRKKQQATVKKSGGKPFRRDIQALRAFAVAVVVLYHLWPDRITGGFAGVDIFFVISGFLMTTSIMGRLKPLVTTSTVTVKNVFKLLSEFYARRISRLVPAALVTLSGTLILAYLTNNLTVMVTTAKNIISSATFWENWHLASQSVDYLHAEDAATATEHFWSLSLEEQFYLMWPLILIGATLLTINVVVYYKKQRISGVILPVVLLTIASFAYGYYLTQAEPSVAYFSTFARIWELMLGGIIAFLPVIKNYDLKLLMPHVGLAMCLYSVFFITGDGFPGWHALIPTLGTAMIIWAGIGKSESKLSFDSIFALRPIQWIGNISYSVYLWHFPLIVLLPLILHLDIEGTHGRLIKLGIIAASLIMAQLSYMYVEETTRKVKLKLRYIYLLFILATGLVVGGGFAIKHYGTTQVNSRLSAMHSAALDKSNICFGARALLNQDGCKDPYGEYNSDYASVGKLDSFHLLVDSALDCSGYAFKSQNKAKWVSDSCIFGDTDSKDTIVLFGDSHIQQYANAFDVVGEQLHYKVIMLSISGCEWTKNESIDACEERMDYILTSRALKEASVVVIGRYFQNNFENIRGTVQSVNEAATGRVVLIKDAPATTSHGIESCYYSNKKCSLERKHAVDSGDVPINKFVESGVIKKENILFIDDLFCDNKSCYTTIGGVPVYYNTSGKGTGYRNSHITPTYSYSLGPAIGDRLVQAGIINSRN